MLRLLAAADPLPALRLMAEAGVLAQVIPGPVALERLARPAGGGARRRPAAAARRRCCGRRRPRRRRSPQAVAARWRARPRRDAERGSPPLDRGSAPAARSRRRAAGSAGARSTGWAPNATATWSGSPRPSAPDDAALAAALAEAAAWRPRKLPLDGDDLIALGLPPGPRRRRAPGRGSRPGGSRRTSPPTAPPASPRPKPLIEAASSPEQRRPTAPIRSPVA